MDAVLSVGKLIGGPGSLGFFLLAASIGAVWGYAWPRRRREGQVLVVAVTLLYLTLSMPAVAGTLVDALPPVPAEGPMDAPIKTLFVLGGDNNIGRITEAQRVYRATRPERVWLLGSGFMHDDLVMVGAPASALTVDSTASTTLAQMDQVRDLMRPDPRGRAVIVASRLQAPRVAELTAALGITATIASAPLDSPLPTRGVRRIVPAWSALAASRDAIYEHLALAYYRWRGRIG